jgi:cold shock CspA family protein
LQGDSRGHPIQLFVRASTRGGTNESTRSGRQSPLPRLKIGHHRKIDLVADRQFGWGTATLRRQPQDTFHGNRRSLADWRIKSHGQLRFTLAEYGCDNHFLFIDLSTERIGLAGLLNRDDARSKVFVHISAVERAGMQSLNGGQKGRLRHHFRSKDQQVHRRNLRLRLCGWASKTFGSGPRVWLAPGSGFASPPFCHDVQR